MAVSMSMDVQLKDSFAEAIDRTIDALKQEGFGVLTRIDVHDTLREKIGVEFQPYTILGACNPTLAHRALSATTDVGLFLPCNVTVESMPDGGSLVRIVDPNEMMKMGGFNKIENVAEVGAEAFERLRRVADALAQ
jgi:uncharacterized protein (DUF302 family)